MPYYKPLKHEPAEVRRRTVDGLQRLRKQFADAPLPEKSTARSLILGTWNIRNFDDNRFGHGPRLPESLHYLAEIIDRFDILAVQEVCEDLAPLERLMALLGRKYDYMLTDVTHGALGGNDERLGFIYDRDKVKFKGVAGEIVLPDRLLISEDGQRRRQFARTPFGALFQSGWFKFSFTTVHIYYGKDSPSSPEYRRRVQEIETISKYLSEEAEESDANQILVGDFNITEPGSDGFNALERNGFTVVKNRLGSNSNQTRFYDQISFRSRANELQLTDPGRDDRVFQFFQSVFRPEDFPTYRGMIEDRTREQIAAAEETLAQTQPSAARLKLEKQIETLRNRIESDASLEAYYTEWRTFQMSDHLPLWVELEVDFSDAYLEHLKAYVPPVPG